VSTVLKDLSLNVIWSSIPKYIFDGQIFIAASILLVENFLQGLLQLKNTTTHTK
jgi:hypothetical protein